MPFSRLKGFLDENQVAYKSIEHAPAYTAQEIAASAHIPGQNVAKIVIVKVDGSLKMVVLPANDKINFNRLRESLHAETVELASEEEFTKLFPECEAGAMPPFGNLYGFPVYVSEDLTRDRRIAFNACSHYELLEMTYADFDRLVHPEVIRV
jgi:Ala-tRNA(Pro) deacylase